MTQPFNVNGIKLESVIKIISAQSNLVHYERVVRSSQFMDCEDVSGGQLPSFALSAQPSARGRGNPGFPGTCTGGNLAETWRKPGGNLARHAGEPGGNLAETWRKPGRNRAETWWKPEGRSDHLDHLESKLDTTRQKPI